MCWDTRAFTASSRNSFLNDDKSSRTFHDYSSQFRCLFILLQVVEPFVMDKKFMLVRLSR